MFISCCSLFLVFISPGMRYGHVSSIGTISLRTPHSTVFMFTCQGVMQHGREEWGEEKVGLKNRVGGWWSVGSREFLLSQSAMGAAQNNKARFGLEECSGATGRCPLVPRLSCPVL